MCLNDSLRYLQQPPMVWQNTDPLDMWFAAYNSD